MPSGARGLQRPLVRGRLMGSLRCNDIAFLADCSHSFGVASSRIISLRIFVKTLLIIHSVR